MTQKIRFLMIAGLIVTNLANAQKPAKEKPAVDSTFADFDMLFNDLDALLDSLTAPKSFYLFNLGISNNYFDYQSKSSFILEPYQKITYSPSLAYFDKSGFGISTTALMINDGQHLNPFQFFLTGSYDYLKNTKFISGISFTHFFTKDSLPFYTSPLKNEGYAYFTYRKSWLKPGVAVSYSWGSRSDYLKRQDYIEGLQLASNGFTTINSHESINDFTFSASIRHDFFYINVISKSDYVRVTPQIIYVSGTKQFGYNQTTTSYSSLPLTGLNVQYNSDKISLDNQFYFQPLSLSAAIKAEYAKSRFFVQPQLLLGYYFPAKGKNFSTVYSIDAGVIF